MATDPNEPVYEYVKGEGWVIKCSYPGELKKHPHDIVETSGDYFYTLNENLDNKPSTSWYDFDTIEDGFSTDPLPQGVYKFEVWLPPSQPYWAESLSGELFNETDALERVAEFNTYFEEHHEWRCRLVRVE